MASTSDIWTDAFGRIKEEVHAVLDGIDERHLGFRPDPDANSVAWLIWHLTRVQDDHIAGAAGMQQVWTTQGWNERFGLPFDPSAHGYGQSSEDVAALGDIPAEKLLGYYDAVHEQTLQYVGNLSEADLDRIVDENWDPPVTLAARLVSVLDDDLEHAGQAAFVKGALGRS